MASKIKAFLSRSVSLSLAALLVLTGAMFLITTLEQDHQEWKLVEDEVISDYSVVSSFSVRNSDAGEFVNSFDEETATYSMNITGGSKGSTNIYQAYVFTVGDNFDFSKPCKISVVSDIPLMEFFLISDDESQTLFKLRNFTANDDGMFSADIILYEQYLTDLSFKGSFAIGLNGLSSSATFADTNISMQIYTLEDDNAGSVAAAITGLTLIVMGVFATPMLNVFRRR